MQIVLMGIGCVWVLAAIAFVFAMCRAAQRRIPYPEAENIPTVDPNTGISIQAELPAQDDFGDCQNAPRTVVVPSPQSQPILDKSVLREVPHATS